MAKSVFAVPEKRPRVRKSSSLSVFALAPEERLTVRDLSIRFGVSQWTVYRWVATKRFPHIKVSNRVIRFRLSDVEQYEKLHTAGRL